MVNTVNQISVFCENRPGQLAKLTAYLSESEVNMRAFSVAETRDFGVVRMIVDDPYKAARALKDADYVVSVTPVLAIEIPDEPGGLDKLLQIFADLIGKAIADRDTPDVMPLIQDRLPAGISPDIIAEGAKLLPHFLETLRIMDHRTDLPG